MRDLPPSLRKYRRCDKVQPVAENYCVESKLSRLLRRWGCTGKKNQSFSCGDAACAASLREREREMSDGLPFVNEKPVL